MSTGNIWQDWHRKVTRVIGIFASAGKIVPNAPTNVSVVVGSEATAYQAAVSWTASSWAKYPVTGYTITASPGGAVGNTANTTYTFTNLSPATTYTFSVVANNAIGSSDAAVSAGALMVPAAPTLSSGGTPPAGDATGYPNSTVSLSWNSISGATSYRWGVASGSTISGPTTTGSTSASFGAACETVASTTYAVQAGNASGWSPIGSKVVYVPPCNGRIQWVDDSGLPETQRKVDFNNVFASPAGWYGKNSSDAWIEWSANGFATVAGSWQVKSNWNYVNGVAADDFGGFVVTVTLTDGEYDWRIRSTNPTGIMSYSNVVHF